VAVTLDLGYLMPVEGLVFLLIQHPETSILSIPASIHRLRCYAARLTGQGAPGKIDLFTASAAHVGPAKFVGKDFFFSTALRAFAHE